MGTVLLGGHPGHLTELAIGLAAVGLVLRFPVWSLVALGWVLGMLSLRGLLGSMAVGLLLPVIGWAAHRLGARIPRLFWVFYGAIAGLGFGWAVASELSNPGAVFGIPRGLGELIMTADFLTLGLTSLVLPLVLVLALLARRHGAAAALAIVGAALVPYIEIGDPDYFLYVLDPERARIVTLAMYAPLLLCPLGALWARSALTRKLGILVPWAATLAVAAILPGLIRTEANMGGWDPSVWLWVGALAGELQFFLVVLVALLWYDRLRRVPAYERAANAAPKPVENELPRPHLSIQVTDA